MRYAKLDRGAVLFLALVVIVVLAAIALVSVQSTVGITSRSGSFRSSRIAHNVTASGSEATLAMGASNPRGFNDFVSSHGYVIRMNDVSQTFFDLGPMGSFGRESVNIAAVSWSTRLTDPVTSHRAPGYEIGEYCFRKYFATTDGYYGNEPPANPEEVYNVERMSQKRFMTTMYVGPVECQ